MSNQGTIRLKVTNGAPAIEKLWNGRFKLEFFCDNNSPKEDWYHENVSALLPEYGILQTTNFGSGVSEDWEAIPDSVYPDMRLVLSEYPYNVRAGKHYVKLTYETLTAAWVEEKDEDTDYELNGLKRVSRTFVALPGTAYDKVVGTSTIDSNGPTLYLGSFKIEKTDAKWSLTEVWLEPGTLSETLDNVGSQRATVIETIGTTPFAPAGHLLASTQKSNFEGFKTNRFTFLKASILSRSEDSVGSQLAISIEAFGEVPATPGGYVLAKNQVSDLEGIETNRYTFLKKNVQLSESEDKVGSQKAISQQWFNPSGNKTQSGYSLASKNTSDFNGIKTVEFRFLKDNAELFRSEDKVGSQLAIVTEVFKPTSGPAETAYSLAKTEVSDVDGIPTKRFTFLKDDAELSRSIQTKNDGKLIIEVVEVFNGIPVADTEEAVKISDEVSNVDGIPTKRFTFAKGDGQIFISQSAGPNNIPGTTQRTIRSLGAELIPDGVLIDSQDIVRDGYIEYIRTTLDGAIEGVKTVYADVATVEVPGTVECTTQAVSEEGVGGTIAITNSTPRRQKQVQTRVTIEIRATPPTSAIRAYDLGEISCSVTSVQSKLQAGDGSVATAVDGNTTLSQVGYQKSFASSASVQHYVGSYLTVSSSSGSVSYQSSEQPYLSAPNAISVQTAFSSSTSSCVGTGATAATGYSEVGVISRTVNAVLSALNGTTYYQVVTEETL